MTIEIPKLSLPPQALVSELRRELKMRASVYPRWIITNKISQSDASHRINALAEVLQVVEAVFADELRPAQGGLI